MAGFVARLIPNPIHPATPPEREDDASGGVSCILLQIPCGQRHLQIKEPTTFPQMV